MVFDGGLHSGVVAVLQAALAYGGDGLLQPVQEL
jgi:hypothetical protein